MLSVLEFVINWLRIFSLLLINPDTLEVIDSCQVCYGKCSSQVSIHVKCVMASVHLRCGFMSSVLWQVFISGVDSCQVCYGKCSSQVWIHVKCVMASVHLRYGFISRVKQQYRKFVFCKISMIVSALAC